MSAGELCPVEGCDRLRGRRRWCEMHYARLRNYGSFDDPTPTPAQRFWLRVSKTDTCWEWTGNVTNGYGRLSVEGRDVAAHRFSYELNVGPIPDGLVIDHLCRNTKCVNPEHLEPVTPGENVRRGIGFPGFRSRQTHCIHGHEFTPENTGRTHRGTRMCKACDRIRAAARRAA